jgi:hypothetical protein
VDCKSDSSFELQPTLMDDYAIEDTTRVRRLEVASTIFMPD